MLNSPEQQALPDSHHWHHYNEKQGQGLQEKGYGIHDVKCLLQKQMLPTPQSKKRSVPSICRGHLQVRSHLGSQPHVVGNHAGVRNSGSLNHPDRSCSWRFCRYYNLHIQRRNIYLATITNKHYAKLVGYCIPQLLRHSL